MNILHISSAATWRGGERQIKFLMDGLSEMNHTNHLMTPKVSILGFRTKDIVQSRIPFRKGILSSIINAYALASFCKKENVDIIHGHDSHAHSAIWFAYRFFGLKSKSLVSRRLMNAIKSRSHGKYNYPKVEYIICISQAVKGVLSESIKEVERLHVIHSGIDVSDISILKKKEKRKKFAIGYVAAFTKEKDHVTFFSTAKRLIQSYPDNEYQFLLVGDGPLLETFKTESKRIGGDFKFFGFVENVVETYSKMDALLHTSQSEALGTAILDAQKLGLPVVASNVGGIPEIITPDKSGYLCAPGDYKAFAESMFKISSDQELFERFSSEAKQNVLRFDKSDMIKKTVALYEKLYNA